MPGKKEPSIYDLLKARLIFTDEPLWFRITIYLITAGVLIFAIWALHQWVLPPLVINKLSNIKWLDILKMGKGRSP